MIAVRVTVDPDRDGSKTIEWAGEVHETHELTGLVAFTETFRAGVAVRLYNRATLVHDFDVDTCGEAGLWATWWAQGEL